MNIAKLHYISQGNTPEEHLQNIQKACTYGAELVQLRLKNTEENTILKTAEKARAITGHYQTRLIINDHYKIAKAVNADGVHLGKTDICPTIAREYLGKWFIIGGTANTLEDCKNLISKKVDYIGLGPYRFTKTKENLSPILGLEGYQLILKELKTKTPIIAIGGIVEEDITALIKSGVYGIAMSGSITQNFNNLSKFNKLLNASATLEQRHTF
ncbi:thiamine phosphate synthase [Aestuariibaculum sediminum]|uniref:Thiamine-phosphate synthase n=1 Tax=Aestuariibaculum sediminum TaxID=2770637 RepID=A0A8J6UF86_9FLAO|nr:thiamine phosphate synthase [Aestuariibaculum sediminum]MBD0831271.1 thiamine phosphate synthase [Aestuariibaculum sediminum]